MKKQITRISLLQTAKVIALLYFVVSLVFTILAFLFSMVVPSATPFGSVFMLFAPLLYALFGFIFAIVGAWIYNQVARFVGGVEFTVSEARPEF